MLDKKFIRIFRNLFCLIGLLIISPFLFFAAVAIIIEDGIPIFFTQDRFGKNKSIFKIIKMRTMKKDAPNIGTDQISDKHLLISGKVLRKIKLDEFPQLLNVVKGELNLVGPRPGLDSQIKLRDSRELLSIFETKPGITGLSQILGYDMSNPEELAEVDKIYVENYSVILDLMILLVTFTRAPRSYLALKFNIPNRNQTI